MFVEAAGRGPRDLIHQLSPSILWAGWMVTMGRMARGEGWRRDETHVGRENDKGHEAEDCSTLAGLSGEEKIDESRKDASGRGGGTKMREVGTQRLRHAAH